MLIACLSRYLDELCDFGLIARLDQNRLLHHDRPHAYVFHMFHQDRSHAHVRLFGKSFSTLENMKKKYLLRLLVQILEKLSSFPPLFTLRLRQLG